jgi:hypothetical protein
VSAQSPKSATLVHVFNAVVSLSGVNGLVLKCRAASRHPRRPDTAAVFADNSPALAEHRVCRPNSPPHQIVFHNATGEREDFWERKLGRNETFTKEEDEAFMNYAIEFVAPIVDQYFSGMQELVRELYDARRVEGRRVKELLRLGTAR